MVEPMTKEQAAAFRARWRLVAARERDELRAQSLDDKLKQFAALMASARAMGLDERIAEEDAEVRARWKRLRQVMGGKG